MRKTFLARLIIIHSPALGRLYLNLAELNKEQPVRSDCNGQISLLPSTLRHTFAILHCGQNEEHKEKQNHIKDG